MYKAETLNNAHTNETVELDQMSANTLKVFMALKALTLPIIRPSSDDPARFKADMADHSIRAQNFIDSLTACKEMQIKFGDHSDNVHWMSAHAKDDCQTSEHFNKVLKRCTERLHGFTNHGVSKTMF